MEMVKNAVSWFEIPVLDFERARGFYSQIFDFDMPVMVIGAVQMGMLLNDRENQGIGGAICQGEGYVPAQNGTLIYLNGGQDLTTVLNRVQKAGGKILVPKTLIDPENGHFAIFIDTEGNKIGLHSMN